MAGRFAGWSWLARKCDASWYPARREPATSRPHAAAGRKSVTCLGVASAGQGPACAAAQADTRGRVTASAGARPNCFAGSADGTALD